MMTNKKVKFKILLVISILLLAAIQVAMFNHNSTRGEELNKILEEIDEVEGVNFKLNQQIASASAIATILVKANELELVKNQSIISLVFPPPLAYLDNSSL